MRKTWLTALCALVALFWLGMAGSASAWSFAPRQDTTANLTPQQEDTGMRDPQAAPLDRERGSGGVGLQIIPLILIIPLGWFFFRNLSRRHDQDEGSGAAPRPDPERYTHEDDPENLQEAYRRARAQWEWMGSEPGAAPRKSGPSVAAAPGEFDKAEFLRGAKLVYARLTEAFDNLDAKAAAPFALEPVLEGLRARAASGARKGNTELVLVEAELLEHTKNDDAEGAVVLYDVLLRRGPDAAEPEQIKQVWRFARDPRDPASTWRLERMEPYSDPAS